MTYTESTPQQPRKKPLLLGAVLLFLFLALLSTMALGIWQIQRMGWKHALIERVETRAHAEPSNAPDFLAWQASSDPRGDFEYTNVKLRGHFLNDKEIPVYASTELGPGYWIMTPFETDTDIVWVNRGYVPNDKRSPESRPQSQIEGETTVTGLLRLSEPSGLFVRTNVPSENRWYHRDIAELTNAAQIDRAAPYFIDASNNSSATPNWPRAGLTVLNFRDNHLSYALTWFGLAFLTILAIVFIIRNEWLKPEQSRKNADDESQY